MTPEEIKELRNKLGLTQEQLAHRLNITFCTVNRWESSKHKPSALALKALRDLADSVGVVK